MNVFKKVLKIHLAIIRVGIAKKIESNSVQTGIVNRTLFTKGSLTASQEHSNDLIDQPASSISKPGFAKLV